MKKIVFLILLLFICVDVYAYDIDYEKIGNEYILQIEEDDKKISYKDAMKEHSLYEYMIYTIGGKDHYFRFGIEISKDEYILAMEEKEINEKCESLKDNCIKIKTTEDIIDAIDKVQSKKIPKIYYIMYSSYDYEKIDFERVKNYFKDKYMSDGSKNLYKYNEYAYMKPLKFMFEYSENIMFMDRMGVKTTDDEIAKVDSFLDVFLKEFEGKSDYEKIMGVYTYINNTAIYQKDSGYINFQEGQLSAYDVLIKHKAVCIGLATTFQLLMEKLGIDSYIVDHVSSKSDTEYITTHTYNVVKLDGEWYIVDIALDGTLNGLLKGMSDNYSLEDFRYYDIKIADKDYLSVHKDLSKDFLFDYSAFLDLTKRIDNNEEKNINNSNETNDKSSTLDYVLIVGIMTVILSIIYVFTRKSK